jgi:hypothetical protein
MMSDGENCQPLGNILLLHSGRSQRAASGRKGEFASDFHPWGNSRPLRGIRVVELEAAKRPVTVGVKL